MAAEKEKSVGDEEVHFVLLLDDGGERVYTVSHVGVAADDVDTGKGTGICILKHDAPP